jgi:hypothetical protein
MALCRIIERLFFFQPLNRLARRRLQELAEFQCDQWAVGATGHRVPLARCLTEVASWLVPSFDRPVLAGVASMAASRPILHRRIERLLDSRPLDQPIRSPWWLAVFLVVFLAALVVVTPAFSIADDQQTVHIEEAQPIQSTAGQAVPASHPPVLEALTLLDRELAELQEELDGFRKALRSCPQKKSLADLAERLERQSRDLRTRRGRFGVLLAETRLDENLGNKPESLDKR